MANGDDGSGSSLGRFFDSLENRMVMLIVAALFGGTLGVSGNQLLVKANPEAVRPDPWTGTNAKDAHAAMEQAWKEDLAELERDVYRELGHSLKPHDAHLKRANEGWSMIYKIREDVALIKQKLEIK